MSLHLSNEYWLEFDGVDDYVQAQLNTTLDFAMPIKVDLEFDSVVGDYVPILGKFTLGAGDDRYYVMRSVPGGYVGFGAVGVQGQPTNAVGPIQSTINTNQRYLFEAEIDGGDYVFKIDGVEVDREAIVATPGPTTDYYFTLARSYSGQTQWHFQGKIYSFQIGTEIFPINEGTGATITGSEGTVLDIYGATWGGQPSKEIKDVYIEDSGVLRPVKNIYLGTSTGLKTVYQSEPTP